MPRDWRGATGKGQDSGVKHESRVEIEATATGEENLQKDSDGFVCVCVLLGGGGRIDPRDRQATGKL